MSTSSNTSKQIAIIAFNGVSLFHLSIPLTVFAEDRQTLGVPLFNIRIYSIDAETITTSTGLSLTTDHDLTAIQTADIIIVPTWDCQRAVPPQLIANLQAAYQQGKQIVGLCLGTFVLAAADILNQKTVTTHWQWAEQFKQRYPRITLDTDVLYIDEGQIITSAGTVAAIDFCLYLLKRLCGASIANKVAKRLVMAPHRQGGQLQFIEHTLPISSADTRLSSLLQWLQAHLSEKHSIDSLIKRCAMSRRSFTRHFKQITGYSFNQWLVIQRLARAQELLENTSLSIESITHTVGFSSALIFRQYFLKHFKVSPLQYRKNYQ